MALVRRSKDELVNFIQDNSDGIARGIDTRQNKAELVAALMEAGVTDEMFEAEESEVPEDKVLVKMIGPNWRFDIRGYTFTKRHPILAVDRESANFILKDRKKFVVATPEEVRELYS